MLGSTLEELTPGPLLKQFVIAGVLPGSSSTHRRVVMKTSKNKPNKPKLVLFHRVPLKSMFVFEGVKYMKFAPKKGMAESGRVITVADSVIDSDISRVGNNIDVLVNIGFTASAHLVLSVASTLTGECRFIGTRYDASVVENAEIYLAKSGEELGSKQLYSFVDKGDRAIALRPEMTPTLARIVSAKFNELRFPLRWFSIPNCFRYERPQKGRMRQFHQINCEYIGSPKAIVDVEVISLAYKLLKKLGLENKVELEINSLGDSESREIYISSLVEYYSKYKNDLSEDSKLRFEKNPLRILDSKDEGDKKITVDAPKISDYLTDYARQFFDAVLENLSKLSIPYKINSRLVRGLDYYNHTCFEFITEELGAQGTVLAGGRYNVIKLMGGSDVSGVGFASGIERLSELVMPEYKKTKKVAIITLSKDLVCANF
jgi:histidyl-tRNA synthetase